MASPHLIFFEPRQPASPTLVTPHPDGGTIHHNLELFIWALRQLHPDPTTRIEAPRILAPEESLNFTDFHDVSSRSVSDWVERLRSTFGHPDPSAQSINDALSHNGSTIATVDTSRIYRLTNRAAGSGEALAFDPRLQKLVLLPKGDSPAQLWSFAPTQGPRRAGAIYAIRPVVLGASHSLDVVNDRGTASRQLEIAATGRYSGQIWSVWKWQRNRTGNGNGEGRLRDVWLSNHFTGDTRGLQVVFRGDGRFVVELGDVEEGDEGMHWTLEDVGRLDLLRRDLEG